MHNLGVSWSALKPKEKIWQVHTENNNIHRKHYVEIIQHQTNVYASSRIVTTSYQ